MAPSATYSVSELAAEIGAVLADSFPPLWVVGEVQRVRPSQRGHLYFELIEKGQGESILAKLDAVLWRSDHERVRSVLAAQGLAIVEGVEIRLRASVDFYGPAGRLQLVVREVDPLFFLGQLERRRRELLAELASAGLLERNRELPLPELPLTVGLVTSEGSAAYHDFLTTLAESGYGFRVLFVHSAVQGKGAEQELVSALELAGSLPLDCLVLVRGGGSRSDLAVFDSREVARAVALCPVPVVTGLGHEIDQAIADRVAHTAVKTPTKAAELLVARVAEAEAELDAVEEEPLTEEQIDAMVQAATSGEVDSYTPTPDLSWLGDFSDETADEELLVLNRNRGEDEGNEDIDALLEEQRREVLGEHEQAGGDGPVADRPTSAGEGD